MPQAPREVDPPVERVEHHRKAAKELLRAARSGQPETLVRLQEALGYLPDEPRLADAQRAGCRSARRLIADRRVPAGVLRRTTPSRQCLPPM